MQFDGDANTEIRRKSGELTTAAKPSSPAGREPLWQSTGSRRSPLARGLIGGGVLLLAGLIAYALLVPGEDPNAWQPPAGLSAADTPAWLQTLCAKNTRELCALADRARNPSDCENLRQTLGALQALEHKLVARKGISQRQQWVLLELYGQGRELCEFEPAGAAKR